MSEKESAFHSDDEIRQGIEGVGYRLVLDLSDEDADLMDEVAHRDGLQPTQILLEALRAYARRDLVQDVRVIAIGRLADALRAAKLDTAPVQADRRVA